MFDEGSNQWGSDTSDGAWGGSEPAVAPAGWGTPAADEQPATDDWGAPQPASGDELKTVFGIDLGTTYSAIALVQNGHPDIIDNVEGTSTTPSVILFEDSGNVVVGQEAKNEAALAPEGRVFELVKRLMGTDARFEVDGDVQTPVTLSGLILRKLARDAEGMTGIKVENVVITCPAYFDEGERKATRKAGEFAGFNVMQLVNEPTAAAFYYASREELSGNVLVYDLGGGTFDVTVISMQPNNEGGKDIKVEVSGGEHTLGGKDWDAALMEHVLDAFSAEHGIDFSEYSSDDADPDMRQMWVELRQGLSAKVEEAKRSLSAKPSTRVPVRFDQKTSNVDVTREEFESITADLIATTITKTRELLDKARTEKGITQIDAVLLVGGSSKMPVVRERIAEITELAHLTPLLYEPDASVAKGAALMGVNSALREYIDEQFGTPPIGTDGGVPAPVLTDEQLEQIQKAAEEAGVITIGQNITDTIATTLSDQNTHALGVVAFMDGSDREQVAIIIPAHSQLPATFTQSFGTHVDGQTGVDIRVTQGESPEPELCKEIGVGNVVFPMAMPRNTPVEITFTLNVEGILEVHARQPETNTEFSMKIERDVDLTGGMSESEAAAQVRNIAIRV